MMLMSLFKTWRTAKGYSIREAARITGIPYVTLHRLEKGRSVMHTEVAKLWRWLLEEEPK